MSNQYNALLVSQMSEPLDAEKNQVLFKRVAAGDGAAREEMIVGNMPLVVAKVDSVIRCSSALAHLRDDLTSAGFIGLVKAVNRMVAGKGPRNKTPSAPVDFIGMWINREIGRLLEEEHFIRVPHTSKERARTGGTELTPPAVCNVIPERFEKPSYEAELETRDLINTCCFTRAERTFFAMREANHTLAEIAEALGVPLHAVSNLARKLRARIRATLAQEGQLPVEKGRDETPYYEAHRDAILARAKVRYREKRGW
jgi:RNA polymerase sigma factor (sigma-70 family)